jgi:hypothetical protein
MLLAVHGSITYNDGNKRSGKKERGEIKMKGSTGSVQALFLGAIAPVMLTLLFWWGASRL